MHKHFVCATSVECGKQALVLGLAKQHPEIPAFVKARPTVSVSQDGLKSVASCEAVISKPALRSEMLDFRAREVHVWSL